MKYEPGQAVKWREAEGREIAGTVIEGFTGAFSVEIAGRQQSGQASEDEPVYLVSGGSARRTVRQEDELRPAG